MFVMLHTVAVFFYTCTGQRQQQDRSCNGGKNALFHNDNFNTHKNQLEFQRHRDTSITGGSTKVRFSCVPKC